ncbi:hypothetical protein [Streptomyces spirodelae]|uniref:Uncharacterized protein n=1 Tax=Streptomyces spirodelae TaxID=2812904 RepID=A0ABS3X318_9ACTN|nr:hypothetical protein [Streptomyces spirodelae]MBO8189721.1 hypothetical protein [Streptomyces spirodelae]
MVDGQYGQLPVTARTARVSAAAEIVRLAVRQIEGDLTDDIEAGELAHVLREFHCETAPREGIFGALRQLLTTAAHVAEPLEPDDEAETSCALHEAAVYIGDRTGTCLEAAAGGLGWQSTRSS